MDAANHVSAVRQRIAQLQHELGGAGRTGAPVAFQARLEQALATTPTSTAAVTDRATAGAARAVTLGQYLGSPALGALARAAAAPVPHHPLTGPAFHGVALIDPVATQAGSAYGMRDHPILGTTRMHHGQDYGAATGEPIRAAAGGTVVFAGERGGYGNLVEIDHGNGVTTRYAHASRIDVAVGETVRQGQTVAAVGSTGLSTGPHLHFELRHDGASVDPAAWLPGGSGGHDDDHADHEH